FGIVGLNAERETIQNVEGQLSKAKPIIRLLRVGHMPGMKNYSYLNRDFFIFIYISYLIL
ncbi:hypothetical protein MZO29_014450, partial [Enterococcus faecalis]|nr:hypothetical protein [Enterococcus faecalis]MCV5997753.1 hypothetical protein [Enterococcus faecalis]MCV6046241.1 hypothetical protein [Enterococcus faecalis]